MLRYPSLRAPLDILFLVCCILLTADVLVPEIFGTNVRRGKLSTGQVIARNVTRSVTNQVVGGAVASLGKSVGGSVGGSVGRAIVRGALGGLLRR